MNQQDSNPQDAGFGGHVDPSLVSLTTIVYVLQALGFLTGLSYIAAVIINYVKIDDVRGTWLESHFTWQIRTFWFSVLWTVIGTATAIIFIGYIILFANSVWVIYRIIKGWMNLTDNKEMSFRDRPLSDSR